MVNTKPGPYRVTSVVVLVILVVGIYLRLESLLLAGMALLALTLLSPDFTDRFARGWMTLARWIGTVNAKILLTLIFYLVLTPLAWLYRLLHGTPLQSIDRSDQRETYLQPRDKTFTPDDFEDPW
jgi:hypothetical protein